MHPELDDGEHYVASLTGLDVVDEQGRALGSVLDVEPTGGADLLHVRRAGASEGDDPLLVPMASAIVLEIDESARRITVRLPRDSRSSTGEPGERAMGRRRGHALSGTLLRRARRWRARSRTALGTDDVARARSPSLGRGEAPPGRRRALRRGRRHDSQARALLLGGGVDSFAHAGRRGPGGPALAAGRAARPRECPPPGRLSEGDPALRPLRRGRREGPDRPRGRGDPGRRGRS